MLLAGPLLQFGTRCCYSTMLLYSIYLMVGLANELEHRFYYVFKGVGLGGPPLGNLSTYYHYAMKWIHLHWKKKKDNCNLHYMQMMNNGYYNPTSLNMIHLENEKTIVILKFVTYSIT